MTKIDRRVIGDPILRKVADKITKQEFGSKKLINLVDSMRSALEKNDYGIAMAAPQIGVSKAVIVIELKPTPTRKDIDKFSLVLINPKITAYKGKKVMLRDGCISIGAQEDPLYGWSERYESVVVSYMDNDGNEHTETYDGFMAHVMQHEVDHLNGVLFVDRVKDPKTYIHASEFKKLQP